MPNPQTILVTGGAGYLGAQFIRDLAADGRYQGATIRIYDNLMHRRFDGLLDLPEGPHYQFIEGDILDRLNLMRAMQGVDTVVHLAALVSTPFSFKYPEWMQQTNCFGTAAVVDAAVDAGVTRLISAGSAAIYGPGGPFSEADPARPMSPFAVSMSKAEKEVIDGAERGLTVAIPRFGSLFGYAPGMGFEDVMNRLAYRAGTRKPLVIHGHGDQQRPFIHVQDAAALLRFLLDADLGDQPLVNAAPINASVRDIVNTLCDIVPGLPTRYTDQDMLTKISYSVNSDRLGQLGFQAEFNLAKGLRELLFHWRNFSPFAHSGAPVDEP